MAAHQQLVGDTAHALRGPYTIADYIVVRAKSAGLSQRAIAKNTGYSRCRINRILRETDRLPISIVEANEILASMGAGQIEIALANDMIVSKQPVSSDEMAKIIALITVILDGLPTKLASLLDEVDGLQCEDIRKEHGIRVHNAIYEMFKDLYMDLIERKDDRINHSKY